MCCSLADTRYRQPSPNPPTKWIAHIPCKKSRQLLLHIQDRKGHNGQNLLPVQSCQGCTASTYRSPAHLRTFQVRTWCMMTRFQQKSCPPRTSRTLWTPARRCMCHLNTDYTCLLGPLEMKTIPGGTAHKTRNRSLFGMFPQSTDRKRSLQNWQKIQASTRYRYLLPSPMKIRRCTADTLTMRIVSCSFQVDTGDNLHCLVHCRTPPDSLGSLLARRYLILCLRLFLPRTQNRD